jgi:hypothetical protein
MIIGTTYVKILTTAVEQFVVRMVKGRNSGILSYNIRSVGLIKRYLLI